MLTRRCLLVATAIAGCVVAFPAVAGGKAPFTQGAFATAQRAGKPIVVDISAPWCSVCRAQKPILSELSRSEAFKDFVMLEVDFDTQKDVVQGLKAWSQSTLIVFKGGNEVGRSAGDTDSHSIKALLSKAL